MADCCDSILDLGCISSCDNVTTGLTAAVDGAYILEVDKSQIVSVTLSIGDPIVFGGGYLNEDRVTIFRIIDPNGDYVTSGDNDCFQLEVSPTVTPQISADADCGDCVVSIYLDSVLQETATINCGGTDTIDVIWL